MDDHTTDHEVDNNKTDADVMLPGFRFHPTDEELVGFYLKKKIQHRVLPIELIKQVDIYKHDPWDLPNLAPSGEKEWYFYCPRDRKYKNSTRPNRVTGSGFWKATGTDRPIYSSDNGQCIGLKKSLVFYRGRAAKGVKTDWMMHEFRLPNSLLVEPPAADQSNNKKILQDHKNLLPPNDAWAICRIFKKTSSSVAQRAIISHSWELSSSLTQHRHTPSDFFASNQFDQPAVVVSTDRFETPSSSSYRSSLNDQASAAYNKLPSSNSPFPIMDFTNGLTVFSSTTDSPADSRMVLNLEDSVGGFGGGEQLQPLIDNNLPMNQYYGRENNELQGSSSTGFPLSLAVADEWKLNMAWDSPPAACHSESTTYSTK